MVGYQVAIQKLLSLPFPSFFPICRWASSPLLLVNIRCRPSRRLAQSASLVSLSLFYPFFLPLSGFSLSSVAIHGSLQKSTFTMLRLFTHQPGWFPTPMNGFFNLRCQRTTIVGEERHEPPRSNNVFFQLRLPFGAILVLINLSQLSLQDGILHSRWKWPNLLARFSVQNDKTLTIYSSQTKPYFKVTILNQSSWWKMIFNGI